MQSPAVNGIHPGASLPSPGRISELALLRLTARLLCRLQVHLPLPLPRACLPGLLRASGPGLGTGAGAGHERGECGAGGVRARQGRVDKLATSQCLGPPGATRNECSNSFRGWLTARGLEGVPAELPSRGPPHSPRLWRPLNFRTFQHPVLRPRWCTCAHAPTWSPREVGPEGGAELSCLDHEIIPGGEARVAPPPEVPPPMRPEIDPAGYVSVLTVAVQALVPAHAHTYKCARARAPGAVVGGCRRTGLWKLAGGRARRWAKQTRGHPLSR